MKDSKSKSHKSKKWKGSLKNGNGVDTLLQEICKAASCSYISDLHTSSHLFDRRAKTFISQIPDNRYTLDDWNRALSYITGIQRSYQSVQEVKERFNHMA